MPLEPDVTLIHEASLVAVQLHPAATVTLTNPFPAAAETDTLVGVIESRQPEKLAVTDRGADIVTHCGFDVPDKSPLQPANDWLEFEEAASST